MQLDWTNANKTELGLVSDRAIVGHNGEILDLAVIPGNKDQTVAVATNSSQVRIFVVADATNASESDEHTHTALSPRGILVVIQLLCCPLMPVRAGGILRLREKIRQ
jgi:hypothetical protein